MKLLCTFLFLTLTLARADEPPSQREKKLIEDLERLEARVAVLEGLLDPARTLKAAPLPAAASSAAALNATASNGTPSNATASAQAVAGPTAASQTPASPPAADPLGGTTINGTFDGYYSFNFNRPIGRDNLLRAYDVSSNGFSLNQAAVVFENAPDLAKGKRWGARVDLQYGQATQTLQGNSTNEPRPEIYRNIFQAYGTYVLPISKGLTLDFGKWSSSLGIEGNYTKDQMNYSRSLWFGFLPFYHMGVRAGYKVNDTLTVNYWITNGTQQTEAFNDFKDELFGFNITRKKVNWSMNYYLGQEHPDVTYYNNAALNSPTPATNLPTLQGVPFAPIPNAAQGHLHILDSYVTWQISPKWTVSLEGDYVLERLYSNSAPSHASGAAAYARYQFLPKSAAAVRAEYLSDRGGLFSGTTQALNEMTFTLEHKIADGLLIREEWRRDSSNQPFFLTNELGVLRKRQNTATLGLVWWFGQKTGSW